MSEEIVVGDCEIWQGDCLDILRGIAAQSIQCCITSPPYFGLRDYGVDGQIGLEKTPDEYVAKMVAVFREVRRVLKDDGTLWLNLGDSYTGSGKGGNPLGIGNKQLIGIPWRIAFALQADGWYLRSDIIWVKPNPMPESVRDRPTRSHEYIFLLSKSEKYYYDYEAIREPAIAKSPTEMDGGPQRSRDGSNANKGRDFKKDKQRGHSRRHAGFNARWDAMTKEEQCGGMRNKRDVWNVATRPFPEAHFATFPIDLINPCILAGSKCGDVVLDPFGGTGTTAVAANHLGRRAILCELNREYVDMARRRIEQAQRQKRLFA